MATPVSEYIAVNIEAAVNQVTIANGFNQDLLAVRRRRNDFPDIAPEEGKVLITQGDEESTASQFTGTMQWLQAFELEAFVIDSDKALVSIDTRINQVIADLRKKLCEDHTRGGHAIDTILGGSSRYYDEGFSGTVVTIQVLYRTKEDDPYAQM